MISGEGHPKSKLAFQKKTYFTKRKGLREMHNTYNGKGPLTFAGKLKKF